MTKIKMFIVIVFLIKKKHTVTNQKIKKNKKTKTFISTCVITGKHKKIHQKSPRHPNQFSENCDKT